jgi:hypothetical protein
VNDVLLARTRRMVVNLAQDIAQTFAAYGPDEEWPGAYTYGWACGYCGFRPTCKWWEGQ